MQYDDVEVEVPGLAEENRVQVDNRERARAVARYLAPTILGARKDNEEKVRTFTLPVGIRDALEPTDDPEADRRRREGRRFATANPPEAAVGLSAEEVEAVRARGLRRNEEGLLMDPIGSTPVARSGQPTVPTRSSDTYVPAASLGSEYANEDTSNAEFRNASPKEVRTTYYNEDERNKRRLNIGTGEGLTKPQRLTRASGETADTKAGGGSNFSVAGSAEGGQGFENFVMGTDGQLYADDQKTNVRQQGSDVLRSQHHSSLLAGGDVRAAGEIKIEDGIVKEITDRSGHYKPTPAQMADAINEMEAAGVPLIDDQTLVDNQPANRRAKVTLVSDGDRKMDFERFSQTGGNLDQIDRKSATVDELDEISGRRQAKTDVNKLTDKKKELEQKIQAAQEVVANAKEALARIKEEWAKAERRGVRSEEESNRAYDLEYTIEEREERIAEWSLELEGLPLKLDEAEQRLRTVDDQVALSPSSIKARSQRVAAEAEAQAEKDESDEEDEEDRARVAEDTDEEDRARVAEDTDEEDTDEEDGRVGVDDEPVTTGAAGYVGNVTAASGSGYGFAPRPGIDEADGTADPSASPEGGAAAVYDEVEIQEVSLDENEDEDGLREIPEAHLDERDEIREIPEAQLDERDEIREIPEAHLDDGDELPETQDLPLDEGDD